MAAPPGQVIALRLDNALDKVLSGDLAILLLCLANSFASVAEDANFSKSKLDITAIEQHFNELTRISSTVQERLTTFLFGEGKQILRVLLSNQGKDFDLQHSVDQMVNLFPLTQKFGDIDLLFQFRPQTTGDGFEANELRIGLGLVGIPPLEVIAKKIRKFVAIATDEGKASQYAFEMSRHFMEALLQVFPNGHQFLTDVLEMDGFTFNLIPRSPVGDKAKTKHGGLLVDIDADVSIEKLERLYPAVANWLQHLQDLTFMAIEQHEPGTQPEENIEAAPCFFWLNLQYEGGSVNLKCNFMLDCSEQGALLFFDQASNNVCVDKSGNPKRVDMDESETNAQKKFRLVLMESIRLAELGCGSFQLPLIVLQLSITSSKVKYPHMYQKEADVKNPSPAHRFDLRMIHVGHKRFTTIFVRPFINLSAFREMLLRDFHFEIDFVPSAKEKRDFFSPHEMDALKDIDIVAGHWSLIARLKIVLAPVAGVVVSFLKNFAMSQLANPDDFRFWWQIASALHRDLKLMHGRLARAEGSKPSFELTTEDQTMFRPKAAKRKPHKTRRCVIM